MRFLLLLSALLTALTGIGHPRQAPVAPVAATMVSESRLPVGRVSVAAVTALVTAAGVWLSYAGATGIDQAPLVALPPRFAMRRRE